MLRQNKEKIVIYQTALLILWFLTTVALLGTNSKLNRLSKQQIVGVQLENGNSLTVTKQDPLYRSTETIHKFVQKWYYLNLNWSTEDPQIEIQRGVNVPANIYAASMALTGAGNLDNQFLFEMRDFIEQARDKSSDNNPRVSSSVKVTYISEEPQQIKPGVWKVNVIARWTLSDETGVTPRQIARIPFNKEITLEAIPYSIPEADSFTEEYQHLQKVATNISEYGLQITKIENYDS